MLPRNLLVAISIVPWYSRFHKISPPLKNIFVVKNAQICKPEPVHSLTNEAAALLFDDCPIKMGPTIFPSSFSIQKTKMLSDKVWEELWIFYRLSSTGNTSSVVCEEDESRTLATKRGNLWLDYIYNDSKGASNPYAKFLSGYSKRIVYWFQIYQDLKMFEKALTQFSLE